MAGDGGHYAFAPGAGNPGGNSGENSGPAENGTGGLLVVSGNSISGVGSFEAKGSKGGDGNYPSSSGFSWTGGGSGGGSVNVFNLEGESDFSNFRWDVSGGKAGIANSGDPKRGGSGGAR